MKMNYKKKIVFLFIVSTILIFFSTTIQAQCPSTVVNNGTFVNGTFANGTIDNYNVRAKTGKILERCRVFGDKITCRSTSGKINHICTHTVKGLTCRDNNGNILCKIEVNPK
jgi:hypothetical protein